MGTPRCWSTRIAAVLSPEKLNSAIGRPDEARRAEIRRQRVAIPVREFRARQIDRVVTAALRAPIDHGPAGIAETQQSRHLVVGLPRRVVARPAHQLIPAGLFDQVKARVTAGDHQDNGRQRDRAVLEEDRLDVPRQVVHGDDGPVQRSGRGLRERDAHEERPNQTRSLRDRDGIDAGPTDARAGQRALDDAADVAHVLP